MCNSEDCIAVVVLMRSAFTSAYLLSPLLSYQHQHHHTVHMAAQGPTEYSTEEEKHSFCDRVRYCIGGPVQAHMLWSLQIAIIFAAGCEIHQRFASREEKKFRDMAEAYFRILDEDLSKDDMCGDTTIKNELQYEWGSKDKLTMTAGDTLWRKWKEILRNKLCSTIISSSNIT